METGRGVGLVWPGERWRVLTLKTEFEDEPSRFSHRRDGGCEVKKGVEKTPRILVRGCAGRVNLGEGINYEQGDLMQQLDLHVKVLRRQVDIWGWSLQERRGQEI